MPKKTSQLPKKRSRILQPRDVVAIGLLVILTLAVFWQILGFDFVDFDDMDYVVNNFHLQQGFTPHNVVWAMRTFACGNWHPMVWISLLIDHELSGMDPMVYHLSNLLLHLANALLLFWILRRMTGSVWRSAFVAALFAVHPTHVESVAWVSERKDVLSALFWMLTIWAYMGYVKKPGIGKYVLMTVVFIIGLMSKLMLASLPIVLLLLDLWPLGRLDAKNMASSIRRLAFEKIPLVVITAGVTIITFVAQRSGRMVQSMEMVTAASRIENFFAGYFHYLVKAAFPVKLGILYPYIHSRPIWEVAGMALLLIAITVFTIRAWKTHPYLAVGWLWFIITMLPVIGLVKLGKESYPDRYTYVPLIGLFIMVAWGAAAIVARMGRPWLRYATGVLAIVIVCCCAVLSYNQAGYWKNNMALFGHAVEVSPDSSNARMYYASILNQNGDWQSAEVQINKAIELDPKSAEAYFTYGVMLEQHGLQDKAMRQYEEAIRVYPKLSEAHNNLGMALVNRGKLDEGKSHYEAALSAMPNLAPARINLAAIYIQQNEFSKAESELNRLLENRDDLSDLELSMAYQKLAVIYYADGKYADAWKQVHLCQKHGGSMTPDFITGLSYKMDDPGL